MATGRMFNICEMQDDNFLRYSLEARMLYVYMCLSADDDGFTTQTRASIGYANGYDCTVTQEHLNELVEGGALKKIRDQNSSRDVYIITDWKIHNHIQKDRYHKTQYQDIYKQLEEVESRYVYKSDTSSIQKGSESDTQFSLAERSEAKLNQEKESAGEISQGQLNKEQFSVSLMNHGLNANAMPRETIDGLSSMNDQDREKAIQLFKNTGQYCN